MPADAWAPFMIRVQKVARAVKTGMAAEGINLRQFDGAAGGHGNAAGNLRGSGWGAACFGETGHDSTPKCVAWGWLGEDKTNNSAAFVPTR